MTKPPLKVYFGGSFHPPHIAHTEMLQEALRHDTTAELIIVPTKQNPLKDTPGATTELIDAWMRDLSQALEPAEFRRCRLDLVEVMSQLEKNFTVDTLRKIKKEEEWVLLMGSDSAADFPKWKNPDFLLNLLKEVWIVPRGEFKKEELLKIFEKGKVVFLNPVSAVSSTEIRDGTLSQPLGDFLSPNVLAVWNKLRAC